MSLKEQVYSVLFVSSAERFNIGFSAVLQETPCEPVVTVSSVSAAEQTLTQRSFDFIFISIKGGKHQNRGIKSFLTQLACYFKTIHARKHDVKQN